MYQFRKVREKDGMWKFELNGIKLLVNDFVIRDEKHWLKNPAKTIAFFNIDDSLYGVTNSKSIIHYTAEDFYDSMVQQYSIMKNGPSSGNIQKKSA